MTLRIPVSQTEFEIEVTCMKILSTLSHWSGAYSKLQINEGFPAKKAYIAFRADFYFCRIELSFGGLTCVAEGCPILRQIQLALYCIIST